MDFFFSFQARIALCWSLLCVTQTLSSVKMAELALSRPLERNIANVTQVLIQVRKQFLVVVVFVNWEIQCSCYRLKICSFGKHCCSDVLVCQCIQSKGTKTN